MAQRTKGEKLGGFNHKSVNEDLVFGFDIGIASCGWAVIDKSPDHERIVAIGTHCFEKPEVAKTSELKNKARREKRGQRRVISRRVERMRKVRGLIREHVLKSLPKQKSADDIFDIRDFHQRVERGIIQERQEKKLPFDDLPWRLRVEAFGRRLTPEEVLLVLTHLAKHRGFKSNSKSDGNNTNSDSGKMLSATSASAEILAQYRSFADMLMNHPRFIGHKRNRPDQYSHTPLRQWTEDEARAVIAKQKQLGAAWADDAFADDYIDAAFSQRPLQSAEELLGKCPFEPGENRCAKPAPSFETFRLLQRLAHCEVRRNPTDPADKPERLTKDERRLAVADLGKTKELTWKALKTKLGLPREARFSAAPDDDAENKCVTAVSNGGFTGTRTLRKALGEHWDQLTYGERDSIAQIITFNEDPEDIGKKLRERMRLSTDVLEVLNKACRNGDFKNFRGAGHISTKVARKLIPHLIDGCVYSEACDRAGYDHAAVQTKKLDDIKNPTVRRALGRALKQAQILRREFGTPGAVHVELLRDVGKSAEERGKIESGLKKRTGQRDTHKEELAAYTGRNPWDIRPKELELYEMLKEQHMKCAFCETDIRPDRLTGGHAHHAHIWPQSDFFDNSFVNRVCACAACNQNMRNRTPWEWFEQGGFPTTSWENFEAHVRNFTCKKEKKRRLLSRNFRERLKDPQFNERNKVDSSYVARDLQHLIAQEFYSDDYDGMLIRKGGKRRIFARPGPLTAVLRQAWLSSVWKKEREDDRHHAMDALVVACMDEPMLHRLTQAWQHLGESGLYMRTPDIDPPWPDFVDQAMNAWREGETGGWHVCRTETRRIRGKGHDETVRRQRSVDGNDVIFERRKVHDKEFTKAKLKNIPDPAANWRLIEHLAIWVAAGKPVDSTKLSREAIDRALADAPEILADLAKQSEGLPEGIRDRWQDRLAVEANVRNLLAEWGRLPPGGETQKKVKALSETDIEMIHPDEDWKRSLLTAWMTKHGSERKKHSPHDDNGEAIESVRLLAPAGLPRSVKGDTIRRVRLKTTIQTARQIARRSLGGKSKNKHNQSTSTKGGLVENASIARTDVFHVAESRNDPQGRNIKPGYYLVPVYNWQILDRKLSTSLEAILANKPEGEWPQMHPDDFLFSLYKDSLVEIKDRTCELKAGYFRGTDRSNAKIKLAHPQKRSEANDFRASTKTATSIQKFTIDRLGRKHRVRREVWPGHCFPPRPPRRSEH